MEYKLSCHTTIISPSLEEHTELFDNEFDLEVENARPFIEVSFNRDNSGRDLNFYEWYSG